MENLFPDIHFLTTVSQGRLSSKHIDTTCLTAEVIKLPCTTPIFVFPEV